MLKGAQTRVVVSAALAALWLTACGGGGGGGDVAQAPTPVAPPSAGTPPPPSPAPAAITVSADTPLAVNQAYQVSATGAGPIALTLPATATAGDTIAITGVSATAWTVAQNAGQAILTTSLNGNVAAGATWTPRLAPAQWHWVASNTTGDVLIGLDIPGEVHVSTDGGATWTDAAMNNGATALHGQAWISADMTPTADRIVVLGYGGGMYMSTDRGATFSRIDQAFNAGNNLEYESVSISQDGKNIVAVVKDGRVYRSINSGTNFTIATEGGAPLIDAFRAVDSSATGQVVVAASQDGDLHLSIDAGATFAPLPVTVGGTRVTDSWYRVAMSADGGTILVAGNTQYPVPGSSTGLYVGKNVGGTWTWTRASAVAGDYTSVSMSADGSTMSATLSGPGAGGQVLMSTNGGQTFTTLATPPGETNWRAMQLSADGRSWVLAAGTFFAATGQLYTSIGGRTTYGTTGAISGAQGNAVVLQYQGNGVWNAQSGTGAFTIR
jgi:photosystem II stability/assembly factor-like uncharacterized protein